MIKKSTECRFHPVLPCRVQTKPSKQHPKEAQPAIQKDQTPKVSTDDNDDAEWQPHVQEASNTIVPSRKENPGCKVDLVPGQQRTVASVVRQVGMARNMGRGSLHCWAN